jgi:CHASE3 domain sensor protein
MTLARQVARVTRTAFLVVLVAAVINIAMLAYLNLYLDGKEERATDAGRELRLAHQAMLDQETGLRAFLITGEGETLSPYVEGRNEVVQRLAAARELLVGNEELLDLIEAQDDRRHAWTTGWANSAVKIGASIAGSSVSDQQREFVTAGRVLFDDYRAAHDDVETAVSQLREETEAARDRVVLGALALQVALLCAAPSSRLSTGCSTRSASCATGTSLPAANPRVPPSCVRSVPAWTRWQRRSPRSAPRPNGVPASSVRPAARPRRPTPPSPPSWPPCPTRSARP